MQTPPASRSAWARVRFGDQPVPWVNGKTPRRLRDSALGASVWPEATNANEHRAERGRFPPFATKSS